MGRKEYKSCMNFSSKITATSSVLLPSLLFSRKVLMMSAASFNKFDARGVFDNKRFREACK